MWEAVYPHDQIYDARIRCGRGGREKGDGVLESTTIARDVEGCAMYEAEGI